MANIKKLIREEMDAFDWTYTVDDYNDYDINTPPEYEVGDEVSVRVGRYDYPIDAEVVSHDYREHRGIEQWVYRVRIADGSVWYLNTTDILSVIG